MSSLQEEDVSSSSSSSEPKPKPEIEKQNFTPIHQDKKRLPQPICIATLCPTMDLAAVGLHKQLSTSASSHSHTKSNSVDEDNNDTTSATCSCLIKIYSCSTIMVYRSIKWEKMFIINQTDVSNSLSDKLILDDNSNTSNNNKHQEEDTHNDNNINNDHNNYNSNDDMQSILVSSLTWSPDGRTLVLGLNNGCILLYDIESCASPGVTPKPAVCLPCPPALPTLSMALLYSFAHHEQNDNPTYNTNKPLTSPPSSTITTTSSSSILNYSPAVTRSMTAARRKKIAEMIGKPITSSSINYDLSTTSANKSNDNNNYTIENYSKLKSELPLYKNTIISLHWQRIKPCYKDWKHTNESIDQNVSWYYQLHYLDKAKHFLPPCAYNLTYPENNYNIIDDGYGSGFGGGGSSSHVNGMNSGDSGGASGGGGSSSRQSSEHLDHHNDFMEHMDNHRPKCQTPLSVLFSITCSNGIHLYLQGRYRILSLPFSIALCNQSTSITASWDLSKFLVCATCIADTNRKITPSLAMYTIPDFTTKRYQLQIITSSYCAIMSHLTALHEGMKETQGAWSGSLRQLDMKFDQLSTLLTKYGVMPSTCNTTVKKMSIVRRELMKYILGGHSTRSTNTSNAMDQFFTHPLMNDQLLQRLIKSLEANITGVEGMMRKKLMGPVRALLYDVVQLHGQVKAMSVDTSGSQFDSVEHVDGLDMKLPIMNEQTSLRLYEASEVLFFIAEQCVSQLVEMRFRLSCMMKWIRGTASQVKARGTASDSVQRENAKKRRVPEQILRKVADFLSHSLHSEGIESDTTKCGSSECVLGILLSDYFCKNKVSIAIPPTPLSTREFNCSTIPPVETPSMKAALEISTQIAIDLFEEPRSSLKQSLSKTRIILDECKEAEEKVVTVHSRIGAAPNSADDVENCFNPNINSTHSNGSISLHNRNWFIIANSCSSKVEGCNLLQISALPCSFSIPKNDDFDAESPDLMPSFYITSFILLPNDSQIANIKFYGNDGNSTLTSETSPNTEEGKQELAVVIRKNTNEEDLWLFDYDNLKFRLVSLQSDEINVTSIRVREFDESMDEVFLLTKLNESSMEEEDEECKVVYSKWRRLRGDKDNASNSNLIVSGSRAVGAITYDVTNTFHLFDFEEDEDNDDEDESDEDET